jgi:hypothetical protein
MALAVRRGDQQGGSPVVDRQSRRSRRPRRHQLGAACCDDDARRYSSESSCLDSAGRRASDRLTKASRAYRAARRWECGKGFSVNCRP